MSWAKRYSKVETPVDFTCTCFRFLEVEHYFRGVYEEIGIRGYGRNSYNRASFFTSTECLPRDRCEFKVCPS